MSIRYCTLAAYGQDPPGIRPATHPGWTLKLCVHGLLGAIAALLLPPGVNGTAELMAQTGAVTGTITDAASGQPIGEAHVILVGTEVSRTTDLAGRYVLTDVPVGEYTVRVRVVGYGPREKEVTVAAGGTQVADFRLAASAIDLDEIVVLGLGGPVDRRKTGSSLATLDVGGIAETTPVDGFSQVLEGRIPGVRSSGTSGGVGAGRTLVIRGVDSFNYTSQRPVVYIDGVRVDVQKEEWGDMQGVTCCFFSGGAGEDRLSDLNPEEVDRVEVLKGPAAATLHGAEASAGVIQVFTKRGRRNTPPTFTVNTGVGFHRLRANLPTTLRPRFTGPDGFRAWDPNETLIESGLVNNYDLTAAGGREHLTYFVSGGFTYEQGSVKPNDQARSNLRVNLDWMAAENFTVSLTSAFVRNRIGSLQSGGSRMGVYPNAMLSNPRNATEEEPYGGGRGANVADAKAIETTSDTERWTGRIRIDYKPRPTFTQQFTIGLDRAVEEKTRLLPSGRQYAFLGDEGELSSGFRKPLKLTANYRLTYDYDKAFGLGFLTGSLAVGGQAYWDKASLSMTTTGLGVCTVDCPEPVSADSTLQVISRGLFVMNRFDITDDLFVTLALRGDGNSTFGAAHQTAVYPKADFTYSVPPSLLPTAVSSLRVRGALGKAGKPPPENLRFDRWLGAFGMVVARFPNEDIQPENKREFETGLDIGLWNNRIGLDLTYYDARTVNALQDFLITSGLFAAYLADNCCEIMNRGVEAGLVATLIDQPSFRWNTNLVYEWNRNRIIDLGVSAEDDSMPVYEQREDGTWKLSHRHPTRTLNGWFEGHSVGELFGYGIAGYDPATNRHTRTDHPFSHGSTRPAHLGSVFNSFQIGNHLRFSFQLRGEAGAVMWNTDRALGVRGLVHDEILKHLDLDGSLTHHGDSVLNWHQTAYPIDKRDHIRLQQVALTYSLPEDVSGMLGLERTTITLSGYNLHWWDDCNCADPSQGYSASDFSTLPYMALPQPRRFLLSVRTRF